MDTHKDTLFPKIPGKHQDFLSNLRKLKEEGQLPRVIDLEGTVKLHGMHADIVYDLNISKTSTQDPLRGITFQSRNRVCNPNDSQQGWPFKIAKQPSALIDLKTQVLAAYEKHNPSTPLSPGYPLIVAGEWVGGNVQREVALAQLSERFVVLSVQINGIWQRDSEYKDVQAPAAGIYNIFCCGSQIKKFDTADLTDSNPALLELQGIADVVEASCPFAKHFGVKGSGEGIVWKPGFPAGRADPKLWLKTKGPIFGQENRIDPGRIAKDQERQLNVAGAVARWANQRRIDQAFEYLLEMGMDPTRDSLKHFADWLVTDIMVEEKRDIEDMKKRLGNAKEVEKALKTKIVHAARDAYLGEMKACGVHLPWATWLESPCARGVAE